MLREPPFSALDMSASSHLHPQSGPPSAVLVPAERGVLVVSESRTPIKQNLSRKNAPRPRPRAGKGRKGILRSLRLGPSVVEGLFATSCGWIFLNSPHPGSVNGGDHRVGDAGGGKLKNNERSFGKQFHFWEEHMQKNCRYAWHANRAIGALYDT